MIKTPSFQCWGAGSITSRRTKIPHVVGGLQLVSSSLETPWSVVCRAPPSMGFSRQEYFSGLPLPSPRDLPDPGIEPESLTPPALVAAIKVSMSQTGVGMYFLLILNEVRPFHGSLQWSSSSSGPPCWCVSGRPLTGVEMYEGGPDLGPGF